MRISLFCGPGGGKSCLAAWIFSQLKKKSYSIELVSEYIKNWAYLNRVTKSFDQCYIFGKQLHYEDVLFQAGIKNLVTDSPVLMQIAYAKKYEVPIWQELLGIALKYEQINPSLNIVLDRSGIDYQQIGRYEDSSGAILMDQKIEELLIDNQVSYKKFISKNWEEILDYIESKII